MSLSGTFTAAGQVSATYAVGTGTRLRVALEGFAAKCIIVAELSQDSGTTWGFVREYTEQDFERGMSGALFAGLPTGVFRLRATYLNSGSLDWVLTS